MAVLSRLLPALAAALALAGPAAAAPPMQPVDGRFQDQAVLEDLESPMAVRFAPPPDGRIFVADKSGTVRVYESGSDQDPLVTVDLADEVHDFWDRGLLGMTLDPAFAINGRIYVLYTRDAAIGGAPPRWGDTCPDPPGANAAGCVVSGALARITVNELGVATEIRTLIQDEWCQQFPSHSVGTVAFGPDGMLYAGAGDGANFTQPDWGQLPGVAGYPPNPCGDPVDEGGSMRSQDLRTTQDPTGLSGAIIRVDPATGEGAAGNPFASGDAGARRVIAYGLRNPFRWTFRPGTDEIWLGDVGMAAWEEIDVISDADDAVAENFGWPCFEGAGRQAGWTEVPQCGALASSAATPPRFAYEHAKEVVPGDGCRWSHGASVSGMAFPSGYAGEWAGSLFFADYVGGCIFAMAPGDDGRPDPANVALFARSTGSAGPIELQDGPGGDLYYTYFDPEQPGQGSLHRIRYVQGDRGPEAAVVATPTEGPVPLDVAFSAAGSTDPDGDELDYAWDLDGDGAYDDATGAETAHTYPQAGTVRAGVRVTDTLGETASAHVRVTAGDTSPRPVIESPAGGSAWSVGAPIVFQGSAEDDEETLGPGALRWILTLDHCPLTTDGCHVHPIEKVTGASGSIVGPAHDYPSRLVLTLVATDSHGLTGSRSVRLEPRAAEVRVRTDAPGTQASIDGIEGEDVRRTVIAGTRVTIAAEAEQRVGGELWRFGGWSDGAFGATRELAPAQDVSVIAHFDAEPAPAPIATAAPTATAAPGPEAPRAPAPAPLRIRVDRSAGPRRLAPRLPVLVRCSRACSITAAATLIAGRSEHRLPAARALWRPAGRRLELRMPARVRRAARRSLRRGRHVRVRLRLAARDADGRLQRRTVTLPLRLP